MIAAAAEVGELALALAATAEVGELALALALAATAEVSAPGRRADAGDRRGGLEPDVQLGDFSGGLTEIHFAAGS